MPDTDRLINKAQGDDIITALNGITSRLQEMYTVDDALSSSSENPVQNKVVKAALDNKADDSDLADKADKSDIASTQNISGNPLTLTDCAPINAESLVVELEPIQDLHGQSAPYVGGAGKNKLPMTVEGIKAANTDGTWSGNVYTINNSTFTILTDSDGNVTGIEANTNGAASAWCILNLCDLSLPSGSYILSNTFASGSIYVEYYGYGATNGSAEVPLTTSGATGDVYIAIRVGETVTNRVMRPMIRLSTETDPTFAPYSNICPITGYTECEVDDVGKNILEPTAQTQTINQVTFTKNSDGTYTVNGTASEATFFYPCGQYASFDMNGKTISGCPSGGSTGSYWFSFSNSTEAEFDTGNGAAVTREVSGAPVFVMLQGASLNNAVLKPMICSSSAENPTAYEPYHSSNATIQFGQTIYGGEVDFLTGVLTVDSGIIASYNGETLPSTWISDRDVYVAGTTPTTGAQVCYKLATPQTIQLTPQELKLLKQYNYITTNGTTITLGYQPDNVIGEVKGEIEAIDNSWKNILPMTRESIKASNSWTWTDDVTFKTNNITCTLMMDGGDITGIHVVSTEQNGEFFHLCPEGLDYSRFGGCILSGCDVGDDSKIFIAVRNWGDYTYYAKNTSGETVIDDIPTGQRVNIYVYFPAGGTVDTIIRPMIRKGGNNTYTPPKPSTELLMDLIAYLFTQI